MSLDIAMGGSTNTVLHLLAAAQEGEVPFTMADIDRLSRRMPNICKVAPMSDFFHVEDCHRAGGIPAILGELDRAGLIDAAALTVHSPTMADALDRWDVARPTCSRRGRHVLVGPALNPSPPRPAFSQSTRWPSLDLDRAEGVHP